MAARKKPASKPVIKSDTNFRKFLEDQKRKEEKPKCGALAVPESYSNSMPANVTIRDVGARLGYYVTYTQNGLPTMAGPFNTYDAAHYMAADIEARETGEDVEIITKIVSDDTLTGEPE